MPSATTARIPSLTAAIVSGRIPSGTGASAPPAGALARWGRTRRPPFAITAATRAICRGVAPTCPWPMATETVSPAYQGVLKTRIFHSGLGMRPEPSWGRSMPVGAPRPMSFAHFARRPISRRIPTWKK